MTIESLLKQTSHFTPAVPFDKRPEPTFYVSLYDVLPVFPNVETILFKGSIKCSSISHAQETKDRLDLIYSLFAQPGTTNTISSPFPFSKEDLNYLLTYPEHFHESSDTCTSILFKIEVIPGAADNTALSSHLHSRIH